MTALAQDRKQDKYGTDGAVYPPLLNYPVKGSTKIYGGSLVALDTSGRAVPASADATLKIVGVALALADNSGSVTDGAIRVQVNTGVYYFNTPSSGANQVLAANVQTLCYASDDNVVNVTDGGGTFPAAGKIIDVRSDGQVGVFLGEPSLYAQNPEATTSGGPFTARAVATAALAAYTYAAGVITANANGTLGSVFDGVTMVANDVVLLPEGIAAAAADAGAYVLTSLGGASAKFVLTRVDWMAHGSKINRYRAISIGEGAIWLGRQWKSFVVTDAKVVGTDAPLMWPQDFTASVALVAGTTTVSTCPIRSATLTSVKCNRTVANTSTATTGGYHPTVAGATGMTAGALGTGAVVIQATIAAGTINNADISTLTIEISNW